MEFSLILLLLVLLLAWSAGLIANRLGFPSILGELAAGVIFGPAVLGAIGLGFTGPVPGLNVLAEVGIFALMLYIGMEVDYRDLVRNGKAGFLGALGGFIIPFALGFGLALFYGYSSIAGVFLGLAMGVTSLATKSRILADLNLFGTRIANVLLSGALLADVGALIVFALTLGLAESGRIEMDVLTITAVKAVAYFVITSVIGLKLLPLLGRLVEKIGLKERTGNFTFVLLVGLIYAEVAHLMGLHHIVGAFMAGIFLRQGVLKHRLSHEISTVVRDISLGFLAPIFFFTVGFHVSLNVLFEQPLFVIIILVVATLSKIFGTALFYLFSGNPWREGIVIGAGMNGRGAVEIIIAEIALSMAIIDSNMFSALVLMAFFTTMTVPIALRLGVTWLEKTDGIARTDDDRRGVVIVGAGPLGQFMARSIREETDEPVCLIDSNAKRIEEAQAVGLPTVRGNALREDVLILAGAQDASTLIAVTGNASINQLVCNESRQRFGIPNLLVGWKELSSADESREKTWPSLWSFHEEDEELLFWQHRAQRHPQDSEVIDIDSEEKWNEIVTSPTLLPVYLLRDNRVLFQPSLEPEIGDQVVCLQRPAMRSELAERFAQAVYKAPLLEMTDPMDFTKFLDLAADALTPSLPVGADELKQILHAREKEFSSVIIPGLAIPHAHLPGEKPLSLLMARSVPGIFFPGQNDPVHCVFLLVGGEQERELHLHALARIATLAGRPGFETSWLTLEDQRLRDMVCRDTEQNEQEIPVLVS